MGDSTAAERIYSSTPIVTATSTKDFEANQAGLRQLRDQLVEFGDDILAKAIQIPNDSGQEIIIQYHPDPLRYLPSVGVLDVPTKLRYAYGQLDAAGQNMSMEGLRRFNLTPGGEVTAATFIRDQQKKDQYFCNWGPYNPSSSDELAIALKGLASQHSVFLADRQAHLVAVVTVPTLASG